MRVTHGVARDDKLDLFAPNASVFLPTEINEILAQHGGVSFVGEHQIAQVDSKKGNSTLAFTRSHHLAVALYEGSCFK